MNKEPDNLTLCAIAAERAGVTYGQFMAMGGYAKIPKPEEEPKPEVHTRICSFCGKAFTRPGTKNLCKYCSPECQYEAWKKRDRERGYARRRTIHGEEPGSGVRQVPVLPTGESGKKTDHV